MLSLVLLASSSHAYGNTLAFDDFSSGLNSGGSGWDNDWVIGSNGRSSGTVAFDASATPLDSNDDYVNIVGPGNNLTQGIHREYTSSLSSIQEEHTISFLFRIDALSPDETGDASRGLVTHGGTTFGLGRDTSWALYVQEGNFFYFDGDGSGDFSPAQVDSGVAVVVGDLYSVTVTNRIGADTTGSPATGGEWDLVVTNLTTGAPALNLTNLEHRRNDVPSNAVIGLGVAGATAVLANETSFDQLSIDGLSTAPLAITDFDYDPEAETVTLTWSKTGVASYAANASLDLMEWDLELDDSLTEDRDENPGDVNNITVTFPLSGIDASKLFFRVEER